MHFPSKAKALYHKDQRRKQCDVILEKQSQQREEVWVNKALDLNSTQLISRFPILTVNLCLTIATAVPQP